MLQQQSVSKATTSTIVSFLWLCVQSKHTVPKQYLFFVEPLEARWQATFFYLRNQWTLCKIDERKTKFSID